MNALDELRALHRETAALEQVMGRLGWDQETVMPSGAAHQRAEEMAALEGVLHSRRIDPRIGEWLASAKPDGAAGAAELREIERSFRRASSIPGNLASEIARVTSMAQGQWAAARSENDFAGFAPILEEVLRLRIEEAACLADGRPLYDTMLDDYEPGARADDIAALFDELHPRIVDLRQRILDRPPGPALTGAFDEAKQVVLSQRLAVVFGYDLDRGRIDKAVHPFSSGSGLDVRITTRTDADNPFDCIYSTIHEVGHAVYEQSVDPAFRLTAIGQGASMGVHESQSRLFENQLGRSEAFAGFLFREMEALFGAMSVRTPHEFYRAINRVESGFIRTEADEVHYNLHIMLRFDLERALVEGDLRVAELPEAWDERFETDFGQRPPSASLGCLQDVHWSVGLFGYFPTYSLGNVYAACLHEALRRDLQELDTQLSQGVTAPAIEWLKARLQRYGSLRKPSETIEAATGAPISSAPLLDYLEWKFTRLYDL